MDGHAAATGQAEHGSDNRTSEPDSPKRRSRGRRRQSQILVAALTAAAAVGGAFAGCHPTDTPVMDPLYAAAVAAAVTFAASRSSRSPLLIMATVGVALSRGWLWAPAGAALGLAFASAFMRRAHRRFNALIGALGVQVLLRWPHIGPQGVTALVAAAVIAPVMFSAWRHRSTRTGNRVLIVAGGLVGLGVVLTAPVAVSWLSARSSIDRATHEAHKALTDVGNSDPAVAAADLKSASVLLGRAYNRVHAWWNVGGYVIPVVAQQERAVNPLTKVGWQLTASAAREAGSIDFHDLRYQGGRVDIARIQALQAPVTTLDKDVAAAQSALGRIHSPWLLSAVTSRTHHLAAELTKARKETSLAVLAVKDAPSLLGADGTRHYLVAFVTPSETRGLGGFIGAYGVLSVDQGRITLGRTGQAAELINPKTATDKLTGPATYLARYGAFHPQDHFQDLTYSPNFPSDAQAIAQVFPQVTGTPIDGVLAVDPYALASLLRFTGPIKVAGLSYQLTASNAADVLLRRQYLETSVTNTQRHDLLQDALAVGFKRLSAGSLPAARELAKVLDPFVKQGRLLFWSARPSDDALLQRIGIDGAFPHPDGGDLLAVAIANAANNKIDDYLREAITDQVRYDPATGTVNATVTITLRNTAPSSGMPPYVIGSFAHSGLPPGTNYMWLSLYSPLDLTGSSLDGQPITFSGAVGEAGSQVYSAFISIPSMATAALKVQLSGHIDPGSNYRLTTWSQPLVVPPTLTVAVADPSKGSPGTWSTGRDEVERHAWNVAGS